MEEKRTFEIGDSTDTLPMDTAMTALYQTKQYYILVWPNRVEVWKQSMGGFVLVKVSHSLATIFESRTYREMS